MPGTRCRMPWRSTSVPPWGQGGGGGGHLAGVGRRMADHIIANTSRLCRPAICSPLARARSRPAPFAAMLGSTMCYEEGQCTC
jgi:hypothetical protein